MSPAAKIGLFMLLGLIILGVFIIKIEDIPVGERGDRLVVTARFESVAGLDRQAAVRIAGVRIGKVEDISLDGSEAILLLSLQPSVRLHEGATAQVASLGMLGDKYVEILPGDPARPLLPPRTELSGETAPSFEDVMKAASDIGEDVKEVSEALRGSMGGAQGEQALAEIVDNIRELTASLKVLIAENQANVNQTTANFRDFSATLRDELPRIAEKMNALADQLDEVVGENREDLNASMANIRELTTKLQASADNLNDITGKIAAGEGSIGKLVNDDTTVDNLNETLDSIEGGIGMLNDTMGRYRRFNLEIGLRAEALPNNNKSRFAFGIDLWTTARRFFRVEGVDMPFGDLSTRTDFVTIEFDDGTSESYQETQIREENKLGLNAQVGYQIFPNTVVRAGLFETTGGVGIDQAFMVADRPLVLVFEAYDFARPFDENAHLKFEGRYFVSPHIFLSAGWDDPLVSQRSSFLIGGGITWNDEDVKYSLGLASSAVR
jgi:phospholipid/cholesterol/gamma-HCH transport system substrate-binding protein